MIHLDKTNKKASHLREAFHHLLTNSTLPIACPVSR